MNIKKSNIITAVLCAAALSASSYYSGYAAGTDSGIRYNSQGKIVFDNGTENTADDVVFDAADFLAIDKMVTDGKTSLKDELNQYDNIEINDDIPEFNILAEAVGSLSDGTDAAAGNILSGKKALVGKSIITGNMDDHSGTKTSTSQIEENGSTAEITLPEGYYDENSKITVPIDVIKNLPTINSNIATRNWKKIHGNQLSGTNISYNFSNNYDMAIVVCSGKGSGLVTATLSGVSGAAGYYNLGNSGSYYISTAAVIISKPRSGTSVSFYLSKQDDYNGNNMTIDIYVPA